MTLIPLLEIQYLPSLNCFIVSTTYAFGPQFGLITLQLEEESWLSTDRDDLSLGFITNLDDAVLVRVDSASSGNFIEMEMVSIQNFRFSGYT